MLIIRIDFISFSIISLHLKKPRLYTAKKAEKNCFRTNEAERKFFLARIFFINNPGQMQQ